MLVLSRKIKESIVINNNIVVSVIDIRGDKVRLGIEAPKEVPVHRKEILDKLKQEGVNFIHGGDSATTSQPVADATVASKEQSSNSGQEAVHDEQRPIGSAD